MSFIGNNHNHTKPNSTTTLNTSVPLFTLSLSFSTLFSLSFTLQNHAVALVSASLDEIAWMYNIRGSDVPCNQVSVAYAVVTGTNAWLFIDEAKVPPETVKYLTQVSRFDPVFIVITMPCAYCA